MNAPIRGVFTALVTPFDREAGIDEPAIRTLVDRQIEAGVAGLVPCGTTGEGAALSIDEHQRVVAIVCEQTASRVPVIAGAGSNNTLRAIALSRRCKRAGADALLHVTPYYVKPTQAGLVAHYRAIADAVDLPIVLYNVPGRTAATLTPETVLTLAHEPPFVALKQAVPDLDQACTILQDRPDGFAVLSGEDSLTLAMIALGADGVISVVANETPADFVALVEAAMRGRRAEAIRLQRQLLPLMRANFVESNPIPVKCALARMGLIENTLRLPMTPLDAAHVDQVATALYRAGAIELRDVVTDRAITDRVQQVAMGASS